jgi:hypothetical protein
MATRWRTLHKKRNRRPTVRCELCRSRYVIECRLHPQDKADRYLCFECAERKGFCVGCGIFSAGVESFEFGRYRAYCENCQDELRAEDFDDHDPEYYDDDDSDGECWHCEGDGFVDGYEEDPIFFAPGEFERCASCGGTGRAKDMTIW